MSQLNDIRKARATLKNINSDFSMRNTGNRDQLSPFDCLAYHWYPATFVPEIPFTLIEVLTKPGANVYDPFGGIGTTYFQALLLQRRPFTSEINAVAVQ